MPKQDKSLKANFSNFHPKPWKDYVLMPDKSIPSPDDLVVHEPTSKNPSPSKGLAKVMTPDKSSEIEKIIRDFKAYIDENCYPLVHCWPLDEEPKLIAKLEAELLRVQIEILDWLENNASGGGDWRRKIILKRAELEKGL